MLLIKNCEAKIKNCQADLEDYELYVKCQRDLLQRQLSKTLYESALVIAR